MNYFRPTATVIIVFQAITEVLTVAALFGQHWKEVGLPHPIPIACVGCGDADRVRKSREDFQSTMMLQN
jgi:hypothetical protein